jgi:hypothetical protein
MHFLARGCVRGRRRVTRRRRGRRLTWLCWGSRVRVWEGVWGPLRRVKSDHVGWIWLPTEDVKAPRKKGEDFMAEVVYRDGSRTE